jgi:hypothetical protein
LMPKISATALLGQLRRAAPTGDTRRAWWVHRVACEECWLRVGALAALQTARAAETLPSNAFGTAAQSPIAQTPRAFGTDMSAATSGRPRIFGSARSATTGFGAVPIVQITVPAVRTSPSASVIPRSSTRVQRAFRRTSIHWSRILRSANLPSAGESSGNKRSPL